LVALITQSPAPRRVTVPVEEFTEQVVDVVLKLTAPTPEPPVRLTVIEAPAVRVVELMVELAVTAVWATFPKRIRTDPVAAL
jgi:hypothetical protein